ncbi:UDP-N-acetylmuramoylalanine--D-glutamate ligase [Pandoraea captiosa]|uniref:UDP-N-acetylmuramoylalanine--D-glutamate ligase n=1 Tax=Pandoraea captiosa TaxID=2508302 RepID=A0A5E5ASG6_9BURK|nr:UDP-N-acetylmuramoyl-L-alanine--D-glutamate ligase [Pandoraea captiosa]VVE76771.1 UDP-N-acetylmuramoylalanine--D-glutamate ligase [Pandoraea captiosa]
MFGEKFGESWQPRVLILGLGESGLAMARWCARYGCRVRAADTRFASSETPPNVATLRAEAPQAEFVGGAFADQIDALLADIELIGISPGLSPLAEDVAALLAVAAERGIPVWGEIEFFAQALRHMQSTSGYAPKVLAITGTNGKTTTTSLTGLLCRRAGKRTAVAGNISPTALDRLSECIADASLPDVWVLELSSFQLETTYSLAPDAAAILNITQDHLDWHGDMDAYVNAKARIFGEHTVRVLNRDDARVIAFASPEANVVTFGTGKPDAVGDFGLEMEGGMSWLVEGFTRDDAPPAPKRRSKAGAAAEATVEVLGKRLMPADALRIRGQHNAANALAALALTRAIDLPLAKLLHGLREYPGEPHRVQLVATINEVEFYDDSKGTNVGATVAAITGLEKTLLLILGGDGKGQDFSPLANPVAHHARAVLLIGRDAPLLREALTDTGVDLIDAPTLEDATREAAKLAQPGDAVLLSPACASFDMFRNYEHRAQVFRDTVVDLAADAGVML